MCASRHASDPGPLGRFAPVADTQGSAPRPRLLKSLLAGLLVGWSTRPGLARSAAATEAGCVSRNQNKAAHIMSRLC
jgi:hypothetical protein